MTAAIPSISHCRNTLDCPFTLPYGGSDLPEKQTVGNIAEQQGVSTQGHNLYFPKSQTSVCHSRFRVPNPSVTLYIVVIIALFGVGECKLLAFSSACYI